ncbi:hypothetical protein M426DRAFT_261455 [Hypoxylon sp. CI-4A]|nr:hypothetical protein M426DRAFT_261455 [Hypoxylon sp. CI-4A]
MDRAMNTGLERDGVLQGFVQRYHNYEVERNNTHSFIQDILLYTEKIESQYRGENARLRQQLADARIDLECSTKSRKDLQLKLMDMEVQLGYVPDRNPYVVVLIDGDGLLFIESLIKGGVQGGRKAAEILRKSVIDKFSYSRETATEVVVKVAANVSGLAKALQRHGCIGNGETLHEFISGFNQSKAGFSFVDMGHGKEHVEAKVLGSAKYHLRNFNCKHVLLGISHESEYAPFLDEIVNNEETKERITILEGVPTVREIVATGIGTTRFDGIFCREKLNTKSPSPLGRTPQLTPAPTPTPTPSNLASGISYAAVTQAAASPPPKITLPIPLKKPAPVRPTKPAPAPEWNPGPRGLDIPITINPVVYDRLKRRKETEKLCNNHFLRGPCTKGKECTFVHDYKPNKEEKNVIAFFARLNPCAKGQDCEAENCIYGHHCPTIANGVCTHAHCKFRVDEHPPGTKFKHPRHPDWA